MTNESYQQWISDFYKQRGWYTLDPFVRVSFLSEETGEVARAVRALEIGRDHPEEPIKETDCLIQDLTEELGDVFGNLFILADKYNITVDEILASHKQKLEKRFNS